jgi:hypothetical protein
LQLTYYPLGTHAHLHQAGELLHGYVAESNSDPSQPVVRLAAPEQLRAAFAEAGVPLQLSEGQEPAGVDSLMGALWGKTKCIDSLALIAITRGE